MYGQQMVNSVPASDYLEARCQGLDYKVLEDQPRTDGIALDMYNDPWKAA